MSSVPPCPECRGTIVHKMDCSRGEPRVTVPAREVPHAVAPESAPQQADGLGGAKTARERALLAVTDRDQQIRTNTRIGGVLVAIWRVVFGHSTRLYGKSYGGRIRALDALGRLLIGRDVYTRRDSAAWMDRIRRNGEHSHGVEITPRWVPEWCWRFEIYWHNENPVRRAWFRLKGRVG